jgi:hypothetical protein
METTRGGIVMSYLWIGANLAPKSGIRKGVPSDAFLPAELIERRIFLVRGHKVMLDSDLADLYQVLTKRLNEQVRRNAGRFPDDFMFKLTLEEVTNLMSQFATSSLGHGGRKYDNQFRIVFDAIRQLIEPGTEVPKKKIGFQADAGG